MTVTQVLAVLGAVLEVVGDTARQLEDESPGAAECGYWSRAQKDAVELGRELVAQGSASGRWRDVGEGPFRTWAAAEEFRRAEVGAEPSRVAAKPPDWRPGQFTAAGWGVEVWEVGPEFPG